MSVESERFIAAATALLKNNAEQHLSAVGLLRDRVDESKNAELAEAASRIENANPRSALHWRLFCWASVFVFLVLMAVNALYILQLYQDRAFSAGSRYRATGGDEIPLRYDRLSRDDKLLLWGDIAFPSGFQRYSAYSAKHLENPIWYAEYSWLYWHTHKTLPPNFLETAQRIDPDNGWFPALAARAELLRESPTQIADITELVTRARSLPVYDSYSGERLKIRMARYPEVTSLLDQRNRQVCINLWRVPVIYPELVFLESFRERSEKVIGDPKLAEQFRSNVEWLKQACLRDLNTPGGISFGSYDLKTFDSDIYKLQTEFGHTLSANNIYLAAKMGVPAPYTKDDLAPGRKMEHALVARKSTGVVWGMFLLLIGALALLQLRYSRVHKRISVVLLSVFSREDWVWLVGGGVVFPVFWYLFIIHIPWLSGSNWNIDYRGSITIGQTMGLGVMLAMLPVIIVCYRAYPRMQLIGFDRVITGWEPLIFVTGLVIIPLFGASGHLERRGLEGMAWGLLFLVALWVVIRALRAIFSRTENAIRRCVQSRLLIHIHVVSLLAVALLVGFHQLEEMYWAKRQPLPRGAGGSAFSETALQQLKEHALSKLKEPVN